MRAEHPQHPPGPRGAVQRRIVVDDEAMAVSEPQCLHAARELVRRWQHVRRCVGRIDDLVQVHEHRARNMLCFILRPRSEEHTSELQSLMRISYAVFCLKKKKTNINSTVF